MIVARQGSGLRLVTQNDHAHFAAEVLGLWRADGLPEHPRRRELLFAAREHDNGWLEADSAPSADPDSGRPYSFLDLPEAERQRLWRRGVERHLERRPYAALLILEHALNLHRSHRGEDAWAELLGDWRQKRRELLEASGASEAELAADYRWIDLTDLLSLIACCRWSETFERHGHRARLEGETLYLDPFPLAGATRFTIAAREIPDRRYRGDAELGVELAAARWRSFTVRLAAAEEAL